MNKFIVLIALFMLCISNGWASDPERYYYVDDSNTSGTYLGTEAFPWPSFSTKYFKVDTMGSHFTIYVAPGRYKTGDYIISNRHATLYFSNNSNVTVKKYQPGATPSGDVIFSGENGSIDWGIVIGGSVTTESITLDSLRFTGYLEDGLFLKGEASATFKVKQITLRKCSIDSIKGNTNDAISSAAIKVQYSDGVLIKYCAVELLNITNPVSHQFDGIYIADSKNISLDSNSIKLTNNYSGSVYPHIDCIQVTKTGTAYSRNITVMNNDILYDGSYGADSGKQQGIYILNTRGEIIIKNNNVTAQQGKLIHVYVPDTGTVKIYNNTLVQKSTGWATVELNKSIGVSDSLLIKNNILYKDNSNLTAIKFTGFQDTELQSNQNRDILNNNLYYNPTGSTVTLQFDNNTRAWNYGSPRWWESNGLRGNPQFTDYSSNDFTLAYNSPAKNLGIAFSDLSKDRYKNNRPYWDDDYDAGTYEIEDTQLKLGVIGYSGLVTHTLTLFGNYWMRNNGSFELSEDTEVLTAAKSYIGSFDKDSLFVMKGLEYKWLDRTNNDYGSRIAAGFYRLTNSLTNNSIYLDLRDAVSYLSLNFYVGYNHSNLSFQYFKDTSFSILDTNNTNVLRIWRSNNFSNYSGDLPDYWNKGLVVVPDRNYHPIVVWLPYENATSYDVIRFNNCNPDDWHCIGSSDSLSFTDTTVTYCTAQPPLNCDDECVFIYRVIAKIQSTEVDTTDNWQVNLIWGKPQKEVVHLRVETLPAFWLEQNYPNPFNPATMIKFSIPVAGITSLKIYDILGREVATLVNETKEAGTYEVQFSASFLSSGIYFYRLNSGNYSSIKKMQFIK